MYDLIGDIHGHADELVRLLERLDYRMSKGTYRHPDRQVIFVGDFIDRGPQIRQVLEIVRPMVEEGHALAVIGNHELNALAFHTEDCHQPKVFLRHRSLKNIRQHAATILQLKNEELEDALQWFRTLPLWLDLDGLRVVHACWDERAIAMIADARQDQDVLTDEFLHSACRKGTPLYAAVETVLKGKEAALPNGDSFRDKYGSPRSEIRTRWYLPPTGQTYRSYAFQADPIPCELGLEESVTAEAARYPADAKPVFFGHYWLVAEQPELLAPNVACLDYSVANNGFLCAYRWDGEQKLSNEKFVWVSNV